MRILTFYEDQVLKLGIKRNDGVLDVDRAAKALSINNIPTSPKELYQSGNQGVKSLKSLEELPEPEAAKYLKKEADLKLGPSVPTPGKIVCVGLNYKRHAEEAGMKIPTEPVLFPKYNNTIAATSEAIFLPTVGKEYDYEVELAFVIGKQAVNVPVDRALDYVLGYTNANDLSARDLQLRTGQWLIGKNIDRFLPVGPYLVTSEEVPNPQDLTARCWRNGELVQDSNTSDMIFTVAEIVAHISSLMTLEPGDLILTGTPEGVIFGMKEKVWLHGEDEVIVEVGNFGRLINTFRQ